MSDDASEDDGDEDDDPDFGSSAKRKPQRPKATKKGSLVSHALADVFTAPAHFPSKQRPSSDSSDEDYARKSHKKKFFERSGGNSRGTSTPDTAFDSDGASWRRGAARKVVTYNEASVDYGLDSEGDDDVMYYQQEARVGECPFGQHALTADNGNADEIDLVLSHSRDEEHAKDEKDVPQTNLVSARPTLSRLTMQRFHVKWKGYSHIHNTDETYQFLKGFKGCVTSSSGADLVQLQKGGELHPKGVAGGASVPQPLSGRQMEAVAGRPGTV